LPFAFSEAELMGDPEKLKKIKKLKSVSWNAVYCELIKWVQPLEQNFPLTWNETAVRLQFPVYESLA
jgi:hypothetical protein